MTRPDSRVLVRAPGRVNLIGDHTDYTAGMVLPMAIDRWTTVDATTGGSGGPPMIRLTSADDPDAVAVNLPVDDPRAVWPVWGRYVAAVAAELGTDARSLDGRVTTDIPVGAGLSSSAALELAIAVALGFSGDGLALAQLARRAEHAASGVPCGIMDQLCIASASAGHAQLIDCRSFAILHVPVPDDLVVLVRFVQQRRLADSEYADRVAQCAAAEAIVGPLRDATLADIVLIDDATLRRRAHHVVTENERVIAFAEALRSHDHAAAGRLLGESHRSLRDDFATSTASMDAAVSAMEATRGVHGARMTGGGFGGCIVALAEPDSPATTSPDVWTVRAVDGALADPFNSVQEDHP